jgi:flagellar motor component MotA
MDDFGNNDLFKPGLRMVVDGTDCEIIRELLTNMVEREHDPYKRLLKQVQAEAICSIQAGDSASHLLLRLNSMVDIPDNKVNALCAKYYSGDTFDMGEALAEIRCELPAEREEIRFMRRAFAFAKKAWREGLLALETEVDSALFAARDVFEYGISFVIDNEEPAFIKTILDNLIAHEHDPWKRKLMTVKKVAALSIQACGNPRILAMKLLSFFDQSIENMAKAEFFEE